ncbi:MAG TPA: hypothetical protein VKY31_09725 [Terriglobia bacterium]|nr:hypothetical protein [Terriglobia bacterium]
MDESFSFDSRIPELTSCTPAGKRYKRTVVVLEEIRKMLDTAMDLWLNEAAGLKNETLVFLIQYVRRMDGDLHGRLMNILLHARAVPIIEKRASSLPDADRDIIVMEVQMEIYLLLMAETPSRSSEALELAFAQAVRRRTKDAIGRLNHTPSGQNHVQIRDDDDYGRPNQLALLLQAESPMVACELSLKALDAVEDDEARHAWMLHCWAKLPIHSKNSTEDTVCRRLQVDPRRAKYLVEKAGKIMRAAIGL